MKAVTEGLSDSCFNSDPVVRIAYCTNMRSFKAIPIWTESEDNDQVSRLLVAMETSPSFVKR